MFDNIGDLTDKAKGALLLRPNDPTLMQTLAALYLAREVSQLRASLERVTAASDAIPGGYAIRTVAVR